MSATTKKKHVEREIYEDFSVPSDDLTIVKVVKPRGNNLHQEDEDVLVIKEEVNIDLDQEANIVPEIVDIAQETVTIQDSTVDLSQDETVDIATEDEEDHSAASDSVQEMEQGDQNDVDGQTDRQWWRDRGGGNEECSAEKQSSSKRPHPYIRIKNLQNLQNNSLIDGGATSSCSTSEQNAVLPEASVLSENKFNQRSRLFVGNIPKDLQEEELKRRFSVYGEIGEFKFNKEGSYAFIGFDYIHNAEKAKKELQSYDLLGRKLAIRFAAINTGVQIKYLSPNVSNELLHKSFSIFGDIELCRVLVNERGRPTGEGIVIFSDKKGQSNALQKCREECYILTKDPRPCIVEPFLSKCNDGLPEVDMIKNKEYKEERMVGPHFVDTYSFEYEIGQRYKKLYETFKNRRKKLTREFGFELKSNYRGGGRSDYDVGTSQHIFNYKFAYLNCFEYRIKEKLGKLTCPQHDLPAMDTTEMKFNSKSRLYIGNIPKLSMTEERLTAMCETYGELGQVNFNEDGRYALLNFDYRKNAEKAKEELQSQQIDGSYLKIHFASVTTGVLVKNLSPHVSNELLEKAFTVFGSVESCKVIVDDRGKPTGEAIVIFIDKKAWSLALKKCMENCFLLTSNPRPCIIEPLDPEAEEDQPEITMNKNKYYDDDRSVEPHFAVKDSVEYNHGLKIKRIYDLYNQRKGALEIEFQEELMKLDESKEAAQHHLPGTVKPTHSNDSIRGGGRSNWRGRGRGGGGYKNSRGHWVSYGRDNSPRGRGYHGRGRGHQYGRGRDRNW